MARRFAAYLRDSVLDVGCYEAPLRRLLPDVRYVGIDVAGSPDVRLNLETCRTLPFETGSFHCVLCVEVLEHLDNLHVVLSELPRVSSRFVVISLPNCWRDARVPIERGRGRIAHYGLPAEPPLDRHKWFFNVSEAQAFVEAAAAARNLKVVEMFATESPRPLPIRMLRKALYPGYRYLNRYSQTLWTVFEK